MTQAKDRACGLLSDAEYKIILKVTLKGSYDVPVACTFVFSFKFIPALLTF